MGMPFDDEVGYRPSAYATVTSGLRGIPKPAPMTESARQSKIHLNDDGSRKFKSSSLHQAGGFCVAFPRPAGNSRVHVGALILRSRTARLARSSRLTIEGCQSSSETHRSISFEIPPSLGVVRVAAITDHRAAWTPSLCCYWWFTDFGL